MSGLLDTPLRAVAKTLVGTFGHGSLTITYRTAAAYSPSTGTSTPTTSTATVSGLIEQYSVEDLRSPQIEAGDVKITLAAKGITAPKQDDLIADDSDTYHVVRVETIYSGAQAALYVIQARR